MHQPVIADRRLAYRLRFARGRARLSTESPVTTQPRAADWLLIAIPGLIWGSSFLFIAQGLEAVGPTGVTAIRLVVGFLTLACFPAAWKPIERSDWKGIALVAGIGWWRAGRP